ncbi:MAG: Hsp20/alpha crystallin family protein [Gemmatimonadota bacterium]|nr:MAG: Hsp20/alpha crystallin family protein [Gemmatimonadota bacterium]
MATTRLAPIRLSPWHDVGDLSHSIDRLFGEPALGGAWAPAVSVEESADELVFTVEVPGVAKEALSVDVTNDVLTIRGEKTEEREEKSDDYKHHVVERRFGSFQRTFRLPRTVSVDDVHADYKDGLLSVRAPKLPEAKSRPIEIAAAD